MANAVFFVDIGPDGAVAVHPERLQLPVLLSPIPVEAKGTALNTVREPLVAIGCMHLPHHHFEFDSSFIGPDAENRFTKFSKLMKLLQAQDTVEPKRLPPISIFGQADPTGSPEYNAPLSGRRAFAVYGLLTRRVDIWDTLFKGHLGDEWGRPAERRMLGTSLRRPKGGVKEPPFFVGPAQLPKEAKAAEKAALEKDTDEAIKAYKRARSAELGTTEPVSAALDTKTRHLLFQEYMDVLCHDEAGDPFVLIAEQHFLARHKDKKGFKGDVQGCSEFNPIFLLSKAEDDLLNSKKEFHDARNQLYARNRRVVAYIFRHGTEIDPKKWPCPLASMGNTPANIDACKDRFWSDGKARLELGEDRRQFGKEMALAEPDDNGNFEVDDTGNVAFRDVRETGNTMACRFYHGFAAYSPCEAGLKEWIVRIRIDGFSKPPAAATLVPLANARFVLSMGESSVSAVIRGSLSDTGELRIPVLDPHVLMTLKVDAFGRLVDPTAPPPPADPAKDPDKLVNGRFPDEDSFLTMVLDAGALKVMRSADDQADLASRQRLYNLGFGPNNPAKWNRERDQVPAARAYRASRQLPAGADLRTKLQQEYELEDVPPPIDPEDDPSVQPPPPPP